MKQFQSFFHSKTALIAVICLLTVLTLFAGGCSAQTAARSLPTQPHRQKPPRPLLRLRRQPPKSRRHPGVSD